MCEIDENLPRLSVVFLNFNRLSDTITTLNVLKNICSHRKDIEVIAVDNGSNDGTADLLMKHRSWVSLILLDQNIGIEGLNRGFEKARGEFIFVLDDDSHPLGEVTLDRIIREFDCNERVGIVACRIESENHQPHRTWHLPDVDVKGESVAFVGCGFAVRRHLFEKIGWFPSTYFLYQNEIDVAIKVVRQGYSIVYNPQCRVVHRNSASGRTHWRQVFFPTRNTIWLLRRYARSPNYIYYIFSRLCFGLLRAIHSCEYKWFLRAALQGLTTEVKRDVLSYDQRRQFQVLWNQNSLVWQLKSALSSTGISGSSKTK